MNRIVVLLAAMSLGASALGQGPMAQLEEEHQLRMTFETPHVKWGKPWLAGPIKALMFCVGKYDRARDAVEMMQRFDIKITPVYFRRNRKVIHFTAANVDREVAENPPDSDGVQRLRRLLRSKWDLFIFGNIDPDVLPPELQYYMYEQVAAGAGILCVGPKPDKVMTAEREMDEAPGLFPLTVQFWTLPAAQAWVKQGAKPEDLPRQLIRAYRLSRGRGLHFALPNPLTLTPQMPCTPEAINETEYWYALIGELAIWAAGKDVDISQLAKQRPKELSGRVRLRRLDGTVVRDWRKARPQIRPGEMKVEALLGAGPDRPAVQGPCVLEVLVDCGKKRALFFASYLAQVSPADPRMVEAVALHRDFCEPGESVEGTVSLADADYTGCTLRVRTRDAWGRVLARKDYSLTAASRQVRFSLPTSEDCSIYMRVEASVWRGAVQLTAPKAADFRVTQRRRGIFHQVMWDAPTSPVGYWALLRLRQLGYDINLGGLKQSLALADLPLIPYTTRLMEIHDEHGIMKPCCWNDPEASQKWIDGIAERWLDARKHGVFCYSLGDETTTKGCCLSPHCLAAYRRYLKEQYATIQALNKSWGTNFASFDQVTLSKPDDNYEKSAFQQGNYARWYDRMAFSLYNYLQLNARFGAKYKEMDPQALTGFEGAGRFGDDYEAIVQTNGFYNPYPSIMDEVLRSVAPKAYISGNWIGYQRTAEPLLYWYWRIIMNGRPCVFWWRWDGIGRWHGYIAPDFEPYAATADLTQDTAIVRAGLGDLLIHADREDDGIAILYSVACAQADRLPDSSKYGGVRAAHEAWVKYTKAAGFGFRYITDRQVEAGVLRKGIKVLILPFARAISDTMAREIEAFVNAGGTVIADIRPGDFTGHLAHRQALALDRLLGVKHSPQGKPEQASISLNLSLGGERLVLPECTARVERSMTLDGAKAAGKAGDTPIFIVRQVAKGRAILLNFAVSDLAGLEMEDEGPTVRRFFASLYRACGVRPLATVDTDDRQVTLNTGCWRAGRLIIYAVQMRNYGYAGGSYELRLARPMHLYDLRDAKYLGVRRNARLPARRTRFFILSPSKLSPVSATVRTTRLEPGDDIVLRLSVPTTNPRGLYAAAVRLYDPSGMEQLWARRNVVIERSARITLRPGLTAAGGRWRLTVRDLATGQTKEIPITMSGHHPCVWPGCYAVRQTTK